MTRMINQLMRRVIGMTVLSCLMLLPSSAQLEESDEAFYRASKIYEYGRNSKDYYESRSALRTAINSFRNYLRSHPRHHERQTAFYRMAVAQLLIGETESAEANFIMLIDRYRTGQLVAAAAYRMGAQHYNEEEYSTAQRYFRITATQSEKESLRYQAMYQQARCLMLSGNKKEALKPLRTLAAKEGNSYQNTGRLTLAHILYELGDYKESFEQFQELSTKRFLESDVKAEAILYSGLAASKLGDEQMAFDFILKTIDTPGLKESYKAQAQKELIELYFRRGEFEEVVTIYEKGFFTGDAFVNARSHLLAGYAFLKSDRFHRAITAFDSVDQLVPDSSLSFEASYRRLYAHYQLNSVIVPDLANAFLKNFKGYRRTSHWHQLAKLYKAESQYRHGFVDDAAKSYRSIKIDQLPSEVRANTYYKRAVCFTETGDYGAAVGDFSDLIESYSASPLVIEARVRRGETYIEKGDYSSALRDYEVVFKEAPSSPLTAIALQGQVKAYQKTSQFRQMIVSCQLLLNKFPQLNRASQAHTRYWLGWAYFKTEQFALAIPEFELARQNAPELYKEPAGTRLMLSAYYIQDAVKMKEASLRIEKDVPGKFFPPKMMAWLGIQCFQQGDYTYSAKVLSRIANFDEPLETPIDVWRHLAKSYLELANYQGAADAVEFVVEREEESFWKADALLDKSQALLGIESVDDAISTAEEGLQYKPKGTVAAGLHLSVAEGRERKGDYVSAQAQYETVVNLFPDDSAVTPHSLWKLAITSEKLNDPRENQFRDQLARQFPNWSPPQ